jgi:hypothetical protein
MNIIIEKADGSVIEHCGLDDHISFEDWVEHFDYEIIPWKNRTKHKGIIRCRKIDCEYDENEYDFAELC